MKKPLILVTNDDGISAPGIRALINVMQEIGRPLSTDVLKLYQTTRGFAGDCEPHFLSLWSLDRIREENKAYNRPESLVHFFELYLNDPRTVGLV